MRGWAIAALWLACGLAVLGAPLHVAAQDNATPNLAIAADGTALPVISLPAPRGEPGDLIVTADGTLWYAAGDRLGRVTVDGLIDEIPLPGRMRANRLAAHPDGSLWFTGSAGGGLSRRNLDGTIDTFSTGEFSSPKGLAVGPDGVVWYAGFERRVGYMSPGGAAREFRPARLSSSDNIVVGTDGALWVANYWQSSLVRITADGEVSDFPLATDDSHPGGVAVGPDGAIWVVQTSADQIARVGEDGSVIEFPLPTEDSRPERIALGPDGALWFTEVNANRIGRITVEGEIEEFPLPTAGSKPSGIAAGPDGAIWFTQPAVNQVGRIAMDGTITEHRIPSALIAPQAFAVGPDGAVWTAGGPQIGRIAMDGRTTGFPIPSPSNPPTSIAAGPDGALWFTQSRREAIGRMTLDGWLQEFPLPEPEPPESRSLPFAASIVAGPDEAVWFTRPVWSEVCRINMEGTGACYPTLTPDSYPQTIVSGPDGALWFTEYRAGAIGRITTDGVITEFPLRPESSPRGIAPGPDDALWFTLFGGSSVGRLALDGEVREFRTPPGIYPLDIAAGADGAMWLTDARTHQVTRLTVDGSMTPFVILPASNPRASDVISGPDGALWVANDGTVLRVYVNDPERAAAAAPRVRLTGSNGEVVQVQGYALPFIRAAIPSEIVAGPLQSLWIAHGAPSRFGYQGESGLGTMGTDGEFLPLWVPRGRDYVHSLSIDSDQTLWLVQQDARRIVRVDADGTVSEMAVDWPDGLPLSPRAVTAAPDGAVWLIGDEGRLARRTSDGRVEAYAARVDSRLDVALTVDGDGALWFVDVGDDAEARLARMTPSGQLTTYEGALQGGAVAMVIGPDGALWFAGKEGVIGRVTSDGQMTHLQLPRRDLSPLLDDITNGPDGALWVTEFGGRLWRVTTDGTMTDFRVPWSPRSIVTGPDNALWFTADSSGDFSNLIGRLALTWPTADDGRGLVDEPWATQTMFTAAWGVDAEQRWAEEHDRELQRMGQTGRR